MNAEPTDAERKWLQEFENHLAAIKRLAQGTIISYRGSCLALMGYLTKEGKSLANATREDIEAWLAHRVMEIGIGPNGNHAPFYGIAHFFRFLKKKGYTPTNPAEEIELPRRKRRLPEFFQESEMEELFEKLPPASDNFVNERFRCLFLLLYATGTRISEVCGIKLREINFQDRIVLVHGKGDKDRWVPFSQMASDAVRRHLEQRSAWLTAKGYSSEFLFPTWEGRPVKTSTVRSWMLRWRASINFSKPIRPHMLRHSYATHLLERGADIRMVQELLGHENILSTQGYAHVTLGPMKRAYDRCHPQGLTTGPQ